MTVPVQFFGGNSDGAMRMEHWLAEMCKGCRHGRTEEHGGEEPMRGMGCELPADAYADPYADIVEWSQDADPPGPFGLRCMKKAERSRGVRRPPGGKEANPELFEAVTADG